MGDDAVFPWQLVTDILDELASSILEWHANVGLLQLLLKSILFLEIPRR